jgi:hypothetical protein
MSDTRGRPEFSRRDLNKGISSVEQQYIALVGRSIRELELIRAYSVAKERQWSDLGLITTVVSFFLGIAAWTLTRDFDLATNHPWAWNFALLIVLSSVVIWIGYFMHIKWRYAMLREVTSVVLRKQEPLRDTTHPSEWTETMISEEMIPRVVKHRRK